MIKKLLKAQIPKASELTKGEEITLAIRDQIYAHMDATISIGSLSKQHKVNIRTLQKGFKSLFGFTPTLFLRKIKLNLVYRDLKYANNKNNKVSCIACKWGFMHMGRFSRYYTELFGENPSQTLKTSYMEEDIIVEAMISLAKNLELDVLAEGVENKAQKVFLELHGCDTMQGYYYSKPIRGKEMRELLYNIEKSGITLKY